MDVQDTDYTLHQRGQAEITAKGWRCQKASVQLNSQRHFFSCLLRARISFLQKSGFDWLGEEVLIIPFSREKCNTHLVADSCYLNCLCQSVLVQILKACTSTCVDEEYVFSLPLWPASLLTSHQVNSEVALAFCVLQKGL